MNEYLPILIAGAMIGTIATGLLIAFFCIKDRKEAFGFERHMKDSEIIRRIAKYAKPYRGQYVLVFFLMVLSIGEAVFSPLIVSSIEGVVKTDFEMGELLVRVGAYGAIILVSLGCSYLQAILLQKIGQKIIVAIREDLFVHIESLSHDQLHHIPVGVLVTREANDTNSVSMIFTNALVNLAKNSFIIIGILIAMFAVNYALTLLVLCFVPFVVLFTVIFRKFARRSFRQVKDATTGMNIFLEENLSGIKITQIFNNEQKKLKEFRECNEKLEKARISQMFVFSVFRPIVYMLYVTSILFLFYVGAKGYIQDQPFLGQTITSEIIIAFYMYIEKFFEPIQSLADIFHSLQSAFASAEKILSVMDMEPTVKNCDDPYAPEHIEGEIEFKNVWFAYDKEDWILKDVSFHVNPKETVAFVGSTGAGKTTILSLVCRNYDIQKGEILVDGVDVRKYDMRVLRSHFGQMLQDVFLFAGSVKSNIVLREEGFSDEEVWEACRYVNADRFIERLPAKLEEEVRERGNNFSAGQRQLLSFARTIIHKPDVMILDEATANIDTETEQLIQNSLEKMMNIGTMLIVAHRLSTIQHADKIIVINHGRIIEEGNHFELLEKRGAYYELYKLQYEEQAAK